LDREHTRKNIYKNSISKRRLKIKQRFYLCLKIATGIASLLVVSSVFIFGYDFLTQCEYFKAESVIVTGLNRISENEILKQTDINKGMNILSVNLSTTRKRLLAHPWIADAEVSRELPAKIAIRIKEHEPLAVLDLGRKFLINVHGEIFKESGASDPDNMPIITGLEYSDLNVSGYHFSATTGESGPTDAAKHERAGDPHSRNIPFDSVMDVLRLGQQSASILPNKLIKRIQVDREIGLTIYAPYSESGRVRAIKLGYNDYSSKYHMLKNVLFRLEKRENLPDFDSIDLNNVNRIVVNPIRMKSPATNHKEV